MDKIDPPKTNDLIPYQNIAVIQRKDDIVTTPEEIFTSSSQSDLSTVSSNCESSDNLNKSFDITLTSSINSTSGSSKQRLINTKVRAGVLYKQIKSSKLYKVNSKYFSSPHRTNKVGRRWIPPRSPYALIQEDLFDKPWELLVATVFLQKTQAKRALTQLHKFLARFPRPEDVLLAKYEDIDEYFKPLGLTSTRSHIILRFTVEYLEKNWTYPRELYGIGKYGDDSYRIFCINEWKLVSPDDIPLTLYRNWLIEHEKELLI